MPRGKKKRQRRSSAGGLRKKAVEEKKRKLQDDYKNEYGWNISSTRTPDREVEARKKHTTERTRRAPLSFSETNVRHLSKT